MLRIYVFGVIVALLLFVMTFIKEEMWKDFEHCVSKAQAFGMGFGMFLGSLAYSLFSWIAVFDMIYDEYFRQN